MHACKRVHGKEIVLITARQSCVHHGLHAHLLQATSYEDYKVVFDSHAHIHA